MKYYSAIVKMGHCGKGKHIPVLVFVEAPNMYAAIKKAQNLPGIKHSDFPINVHEIPEEEYIAGRQTGEYYAYIAANKGEEEVRDEKCNDLH